MDDELEEVDDDIEELDDEELDELVVGIVDVLEEVDEDIEELDDEELCELVVGIDDVVEFVELVVGMDDVLEFVDLVAGAKVIDAVALPAVGEVEVVEVVVKVDEGLELDGDEELLELVEDNEDDEDDKDDREDEDDEDVENTVDKIDVLNEGLRLDIVLKVVNGIELEFRLGVTARMEEMLIEGSGIETDGRIAEVMLRDTGKVVDIELALDEEVTFLSRNAAT
ncbi:hypothetical protein ACLMJK_003874 [Lecanora helva]